MSKLPLIVLLLLLGGCGVAGTEINETGLVYSGGVVENKEFKKILPPGETAQSVGMGSEVYRYRTDQRSYIAAEEGDTSPVEVVSKDGVRMRVGYQLYFKLNRDPEVLRAFHENLGVKEQAWTPEGWVSMLRVYFEPQIERAMEIAALQSNWRDLFASEEARKSFQAATIDNLRNQMRDVIGGDYFCGPGYEGPGDDCSDFTLSMDKPEVINVAIVEAIEGEQIATQEVAAQTQENERIRKELEAQREQIAALGPDMYVLLEAIESDKDIGLMQLPQGSDVNVPAPAP
jgi:SPFH domain / Band 7 family